MLDVRVLGGTTITSGRLRVAVERPLERALLVRMALARGDTVFDDRLAADLWDDDDMVRPMQRLRVVASRLRNALGEHASLMSRTAGGYRLAARMPDLLAAETAAGRLHTAARTGDHAGVRDAADAALACWQGRSLDGLQAFAFARAEAARLDLWRLELTVHGLTAALELGAAVELVAELTSLTAEHPLHEPLHGLLARALYRTGQQAAALDALARLRNGLVEELGVDPAPDIVELEARIMRHDPALTPHPDAVALIRRDTPVRRARTKLPQPTTRFVGRESELAALLTELAHPGVTALVGAAGTGKSRLASEAARAAADSHDVVFVELAPLRRDDTVVTALAEAAGVDGGAPDPLHAAAAALDGSLLVLDNAEHVVEAASAAVRTLLRRAPRLHVLVTSQRPMLIGERVHVVAPLEPAAAQVLFADRAVADAFSPGGDQEAIAQICRAVDGLPLGIELAAGLTRALTIAQLAARVSDRLRLLVGGGHMAGRRHTSIRAALDWSHELLAPREQAVLRRVGVFAGGFGLEAAEAVAAAGDVEVGDVVPALADLVDRSLITVHDSEISGRRFVVLETVRDYALARLEAMGETQPARDRHLGWCLERARTLVPAARPLSVEGVTELFDDWPNMVEALEHAPGTERAAGGLRLADALYESWHARGWFAEARRHFAALTDAPGVDPAERVEAMCKHGFHALMSGRLDEAAELVAAAGRIADVLDDDDVSTVVLYYQGIVDVQRGRLRDAIPTLALAEELALKLGQQRRAFAISDALASALLYSGEVDAALERYRDGVADDRRADDEHRLAIGLHNIANALLDTHELDEAVAVAAESDHYARRLDDRHALPLNDLVRSAVALTSGRLDEAEAHARAALGYADPPTMAHVELANVLIGKGELTEAAELIDGIDTIEPDRGTTWLAAQPSAAALALALGHPEQARMLVARTTVEYAERGFAWPRYLQRLRQVEAALTSPGSALQEQPAGRRSGPARRSPSTSGWWPS